MQAKKVQATVYYYKNNKKVIVFQGTVTQT